MDHQLFKKKNKELERFHAINHLFNKQNNLLKASMSSIRAAGTPLIHCKVLKKLVKYK